MAISKQNEELENLILTIDTREESNKQDKTRTKLIEAWAQSMGICMIEHKALELCDYSLVGDFRDHDINLGLEYKSWDNFISDDIEGMEDKLTRSFELYTDVALFIDGFGSYTFAPETDSCHCILNYSDMARAGFRKRGITEPPTKTLAALEGFIDTLQTNRVHVRQLRSESQFPYSLYNLLVYLTNPHTMKIKVTDKQTAILDIYMRLDHVGIVRAKELLKNYPNPAWLCSASEDSLKNVLGAKIGKNAYELINCHDFETDEWRNGFHKDGTPKEPATGEQKTKDNILLSDNTKASTKELNRPQLEQQAETHLCTTCTKKPKTCNTSVDDKLDNGINVTLCMGYVNKYPSKPMSEQETKHQAFKRQKAGFKPAIPSYPEGTILKSPPPPKPSLNTSGSLPDVQFIKSENKVSQSQGDGQQAKAEKTAPLTASQSQESLTIQPVAGMTPNMPEMEGGSTNSPPSAPSYKNVDGYLIHHCFVPLTMDQIMSRLYPQFSKDYLFSAVCRMTNEGALRRFSDKGTMKWTVAVKADKETDIGV